MLENMGMVNIMEERKGPNELPTTYDRGQHCLDIIARSAHGKKEIVHAAGFLPFYQPFASDHRVSFVDLDAITLFNKSKPDTTKPVYHTFHTSNKKKCDKYIEILETKLEENRIFQKADKMRDRILEYQKNHIEIDDENEERQLIIQKCKQMEGKITQLMTAAAKQTEEAASA